MKIIMLLMFNTHTMNHEMITNILTLVSFHDPSCEKFINIYIYMTQ